MARAGTVCTDRLVGDITGAAFYAVVDRNLADRADGFVVESRNAECGAELFVELAQILQVRCERGELDAFVSQQEFLVAGVPEARELALDHNRWQDRELITGIGTLAKFRAAAILFYADDAARAANSKAESGQAFDGLGIKALFDIPHDATRLKNATKSVKWRSKKVRHDFCAFGCILPRNRY